MDEQLLCCATQNQGITSDPPLHDCYPFLGGANIALKNKTGTDWLKIMYLVDNISKKSGDGKHFDFRAGHTQWDGIGNRHFHKRTFFDSFIGWTW